MVELEIMETAGVKRRWEPTRKPCSFAHGAIEKAASLRYLSVRVPAVVTE